MIALEAFLVALFGQTVASAIITALVTSGVTGATWLMWLLFKKFPKAKRAFQRKFFGKRILIIGQPRCGKTTFYDWLRNEELGLANPKTTGAPVYNNINSIKDKSGKEIQIYEGVDSAGQVKTYALVDLFMSEAPDILLIFLDARNIPNSGIDVDHEDCSGEDPTDWVSNFFAEMMKRPSTSNTAAENLRSLVFVVGQKDRVSDNIVNKFIKELDSLIKNEGEKCLTKEYIEKIETQKVTLAAGEKGKSSARSLSIVIAAQLHKGEKIIEIEASNV